MDEYFEHKKLDGCKVPRILGLTASVVTKTCDLEKFKTLLSQLEKNTDSEIVTTEENLANYLK